MFALQVGVVKLDDRDDDNDTTAEYPLDATPGPRTRGAHGYPEISHCLFGSSDGGNQSTTIIDWRRFGEIVLGRLPQHTSFGLGTSLETRFRGNNPGENPSVC